jgi:hypothetical protein
MRARSFRFTKTVALTAAIAMAAPAAAAADDFTVNDDTSGVGPPGATCATPDFTGANALQDGIDGANPGDRLLVCSGTYANSAGGQPAANVTKSLSILGAQAGVDARARSVPTADESTLSDADGDFALNASEINVDGFRVIGVTGGLGAGVNVPASGSDHRIANNIVSGNVIGINLNGADSAVRHNRLSANNSPGSAAGTGIYSDQGLSNAEIDQNHITGHENAAMTLNAGNVAGSDIAITRNDVIADSAILLFNSSDVLIEGNLSSGSVTHGIQLDGNNSDVLVRRNTLFNAADGFSAVRISDNNAFGRNTDVDVIGNDVIGDGDEFGVRVTNATHTNQLDVHFNRIVNNLTGVSGQDHTDPVDAENNWWGCNEGPGGAGCDTVDGAVDADPWLVLAISSAKGKVKAKRRTKVTASLQGNSDGETFDPTEFVDGPGVDFATNKGSVNPTFDALSNGLADTVYRAPSKGTATVSAEFDAETVTTQIKTKRKK